MARTSNDNKPTVRRTHTTENQKPVNVQVTRVETIRTQDEKLNYRRTGDVLDHGLESPEFHYLWVNKLNPLDVNQRVLDGFRFVKMDDVKRELKDDPRTEFLYQSDEVDRVTFGTDLVLMRQPRKQYEQSMRAAYREHAARMNDSTGEYLETQLDDLLQTKNLRANQAPKVSLDEDNATTRTVEITPSENQTAPTGGETVPQNEVQAEDQTEEKE